MLRSTSIGKEIVEVSEIAEFCLLKMLENDYTGLKECFLAFLSLVEDCTSCNNC